LHGFRTSSFYQVFEEPPGYPERSSAPSTAVAVSSNALSPALGADGFGPLQKLALDAV
jgi:hypothetical protein